VNSIVDLRVLLSAIDYYLAISLYMLVEIMTKKLPNDKKLDELLSLAKDFERDTIYLYELATEIDKKWRVHFYIVS
jgi:hypothetical protein